MPVSSISPSNDYSPGLQPPGKLSTQEKATVEVSHLYETVPQAPLAEKPAQAAEKTDGIVQKNLPQACKKMSVKTAANAVGSAVKEWTSKIAKGYEKSITAVGSVLITKPAKKLGFLPLKYIAITAIIGRMHLAASIPMGIGQQAILNIPMHTGMIIKNAYHQYKQLNQSTTLTGTQKFVEGTKVGLSSSLNLAKVAFGPVRTAVVGSFVLLHGYEAMRIDALKNFHTNILPILKYNPERDNYQVDQTVTSKTSEKSEKMDPSNPVNMMDSLDTLD